MNIFDCLKVIAEKRTALNGGRPIRKFGFQMKANTTPPDPSGISLHIASKIGIVYDASVLSMASSLLHICCSFESLR